MNEKSQVLAEIYYIKNTDLTVTSSTSMYLESLPIVIDE
jgi:hypothetical protein